MRKIKIFFPLLFFLFSVPTLYGKAKVITEEFKWKIVSTPHFNVHYYEESSPRLEEVIYYLENAYDKVTKGLQYIPEEKSDFFLYFHKNHFEQTNIADIGEGVEGFSELYKYRFVVPLQGSAEELEHTITHEFTHILNFNIWYGTGWKSVEILKSIFYPLWIEEGLAEYFSNDWDAYDDMILRDAVINNRCLPLISLHSFSHLKGHDVYLGYKIGHRAMIFLAEEFGEEKIPLLIKNFTYLFDANSALMSSCGVSIEEFDKRFQESLQSKYNQQIYEKQEPEFYGTQLTQLTEFNTNPVVSPDGEKIYFLSDRLGFTDLMVMNSDGSKQQSLIPGIIMNQIDVINTAGNALSISSDGKYLSLIGEKNNKNYIYIINLENKKIEIIDLPIYIQHSVDFSPDGKKLAFVGMEDGYNNLYLLDLESKDYQKLTDDKNEENYPVFSSSGEKIAYIREESLQKDLCVFDLSTWSSKQITQTLTDEIDPFWESENEIIYSAEYNGIYNLYRINILNNEIKKMTDVKGGIFTPYIDNNKNIIFVYYCKGEMNIWKGSPQKFSDYEIEQVVEELLPAPIFSLEKSKISKPSSYRTKITTDLVFPFLIYSTGAGLYSYIYWQGSDLLGNHNFLTDIYYLSAENWLDYNFSYIYRANRPQLFFNSACSTNYNYYDIIDYKGRKIAEDVIFQDTNYFNQIGIQYPFDRFRYFEFGYLVQHLKSSSVDSNFPGLNFYDQENGYFINLIRDTTSGKLLDLMKGNFTYLSYYRSSLSLGSNYSYNTYTLEHQNYHTFFNDKIFAFRFLGGLSQGENKVHFSLGGPYDLRGYPYQTLEGDKIALLNTEFRFYLFPEINFDFRIIFPDLYIKSLQGVVFSDLGCAWEGNNSFSFKENIGFGLRLNTFLLQSFPYIFCFDFSYRPDIKDIVYNFRIGPVF